jgi:hypothetical protein
MWFIPDLVCHDGNSTLFLKFEHDSGFMCLLVALGPRCEVDLGSNPSRAGVISAFRFCVIESSIAPLDIRKKSIEICQLLFYFRLVQRGFTVPLNATVEKQN